MFQIFCFYDKSTAFSTSRGIFPGMFLFFTEVILMPDQKEYYMRRALALAARGAGHVDPNPMVGCVIVKDGRIIAEGWHEHIGGLHAERNAFAHCTEDAAGADLYVTLEPCCHWGRTPPCTDAVIEHRIRRVFGISTQHYAFVVNAFVSLVREYDRNRYEFSLRETSTAGIIDDVRVQRSELGVLYRCDFNESVISNVVKSADLHFVSLFRAKPHVFVSRNSPLARLERATLADLAPYPRLSYDQGIRNSLYYAEELHIAEAVDKSIVVTDRATLFNLIIGLDGYTISSGILSEDLNGSQIVSIPLESPEHMELGYVKRADRPLSSVAERYLQLLQEYVNEYQREAGE